jgi:predicted hydrocarbon binding protein
MKGIIFRQLETFVTEQHGMMAWDEAIESCNLSSEGVYIGTEKYDDEELFTLVGYFCEKLGLSADVLVREFGKFIFPALYEMAYDLVKDAQNLREFLLLVEDVIHVEVRKLHQDASLPTFDYLQHKTNLVMVYRSPRKLCHLSEGLILAAAEKFQQHVEVTQPVCMHKGSDYCELKIEFK